MKILKEGGIFILPLLACSVLMTAIIAERFYTFSRTTRRPLDQYEEPRRVVNALRRRLTVLHTIITISPMLGLLGTITGLMKCFNLLGEKGVTFYDPQQLSLGISEALITTAVGLVIAVISTVFYNYFQNRLQLYVEEYNSQFANQDQS